MNVDDLKFLFEYDRWANARMLESVDALTEEQFANVRETLAHIAGVDLSPRPGGDADTTGGRHAGRDRLPALHRVNGSTVSTWKTLKSRTFRVTTTR
jgi:hypothetical protein